MSNTLIKQGEECYTLSVDLRPDYLFFEIKLGKLTGNTIALDENRSTVEYRNERFVSYFEDSDIFKTEKEALVSLANRLKVVKMKIYTIKGEIK